MSLLIKLILFLALLCLIAYLVIKYDKYRINQSSSRWQRPSDNKSESYQKNTKFNNDPLRSRDEVTRYIKNNYQAIETVKRSGNGANKFDDVFDAMVIYGITTEQLSARQKFSAIYIVNSKFHRGSRSQKLEAEKIKNYLQRTLYLYHQMEISITKGTGKYVNCLELKLSPWCTHIPLAIIKEGKLDRPGKPSVSRTVRTRRAFRERS